MNYKLGEHEQDLSAVWQFLHQAVQANSNFEYSVSSRTNWYSGRDPTNPPATRITLCCYWKNEKLGCRYSDHLDFYFSAKHPSEIVLTNLQKSVKRLLLSAAQSEKEHAIESA